MSRFAFPSAVFVLLVLLPASNAAHSTASDPFSFLHPYIALSREGAVDLAAQFTVLLERSPYLKRHVPELARALQKPPQYRGDRVSTFLYWSKEVYRGRPVVIVTDVSIVRNIDQPDLPQVLIASKQVFATHYFNGALALTLRVRRDSDSDTGYLVYVNRSVVDVMNWFLRPLLERRVRSEAMKLFAIQRHRIER